MNNDMTEITYTIIIVASSMTCIVISCLYYCLCKPSTKNNEIINFHKLMKKDMNYNNNNNDNNNNPILYNKKTPLLHGEPNNYHNNNSKTNNTNNRSLNIIILTIGTRGDVQPFVALCKALKKYGHKPIIASHGCFKDWVIAQDIAFQDIGSYQINQPDEWLTATSIADFFEAMKPEMEKSKIACEYFYKASKGKDLIVATSHTVSFGLDISEKLNIPCVAIKLAPDLPTKAFGPFSKATSSYGLINLINHYLFLINVARAYKSAGMDTMEEDFRENILNLPRAIGTKRLTDLRDMPTIVAIGKDIIPFPNWSNNVAISGWLFLDDTTFQPNDEILDFLKNKEKPPVCVNFGSMVLASKSGLISHSIKAARSAGHRVLLIAGWAKPPQDCNDIIKDKENCLIVKGLPHEWIFPQCSCVIHHGGAGTLARTLQSGVPSIIVPILKWADQAFWARNVQQQNLGVHVTEKNITENVIKDAIEIVTTSKIIQDKCEEMKMSITKENSGEDIVKMLEMVYEFNINKNNKNVVGEK